MAATPRPVQAWGLRAFYHVWLQSSPPTSHTDDHGWMSPVNGSDQHSCQLQLLWVQVTSQYVHATAAMQPAPGNDKHVGDLVLPQPTNVVAARTPVLGIEPNPLHAQVLHHQLEIGDLQGG